MAQSRRIMAYLREAWLNQAEYYPLYPYWEFEASAQWGGCVYRAPHGDGLAPAQL